MESTRTLFYQPDVEDVLASILQDTPAHIEISTAFACCDGVFCSHCQTPYTVDAERMVTSDIDLYAYYLGEFPNPASFLFTVCRACATKMKDPDDQDETRLQEMLATIYQNVRTLYQGVLVPESERSSSTPLRHSSAIEDRLLHRSQPYREHGYTVDRYLFDQHGETCFFCGTAYPVERGRIRNEQGVTFISDRHREITYPISQCAACTKGIQQLAEINTLLNEQKIDEWLRKGSERATSLLYQDPPDPFF